MININGDIVKSEDAQVSINNRGLNYGDAVFETIRVYKTRILFFEDHYFRLMASMRILRMEIPMTFTLEFLQAEIIKTIKANNLESSAARVKLLVNRKEGGLYLPKINEIDFLITAKLLDSEFYEIIEKPYVVELFKDYYIAPSLLSTLKTNNRLINIVGSVFAEENDFDNCLLLNTNKNVIEALNANIFLVKENVIKTPPLSDGCLNGVIRKQLVGIIESTSELKLEEVSISPFELQKADEILLTNSIIGIQPITKYRKKTYDNIVAKTLLGKLNMKSRLTN